MQTLPFGLWASPLTPRQMAASLRLDDVLWDASGRYIVWLEALDGRGSLWCFDTQSNDAPRELTPGDLAVRGRVGYGGGAFTVGDGQVVFAEASSGRLWCQDLKGGEGKPITPAFGAAAAPALAPDGTTVIFVHHYEEQDCLAVAPLDRSQWPQQLVSGHDFVMWPCWHPAGNRIAYVVWEHPHMPWDSSTLYLAELGFEGKLPQVRTTRIVAGGEGQSIVQPCFSPDGQYLAYGSDHEGAWQVYLYEVATGINRRLSTGEGEYGQPAWAQGLRSFAWSHDSQRIYALRNERGIRSIEALPIDGSPASALPNAEGYTWFSQLAASPRNDDLVSLASASTIPPRLVVQNATTTRILRRSSSELVARNQLADVQCVSWAAGTATIHGMLYLPPGYAPGDDGPKPPAVIRIHGGPTDQAVATYSGEVQFFATRGYVVLDVNYRGSTGYGRAYAQSLRYEWGVFDVADAISGAHYLARENLADASRIIIIGGSAGGYTVLEALCQAPELFRAGICRYGVSNLFALATDTHKFEAHYLDSLVGPLPETATRYRERSPLFHAERINAPMAIFQGSEDRVVPPDQAETIVAALRRRGIPHIYHLFDGEGHGWRRAETIATYYRAIDAFLRQHVVFAGASID